VPHPAARHNGDMRVAQTIWLVPATFALVASALYLLLGDGVAIAIAVWFSWCLAHVGDADHQPLRYLGWILLIAIPSVALVRLLLGE
jgi:hypothetical protein